MSEIRIVVADDHELVREGLRSVIELTDDLKIVGEASNGTEAVELVGRMNPDILLLDLRMPGMKGIDVCREVKKQNPELKVVVLTSYDDETEIVEVFQAGASSYLMKDIPSDDLVEAIRLAASGQILLHPAVSTKLIGGSKGAEAGAAHVPNLSDRELEVLRLMARGCSNKEVAQELWISEATVKTHVSHILQKLNQKDRTKAVLFALHHGLVKPK